MAAASAYLGLNRQDDLRQGHDEALEGNGDILQHEVCDPHDPEQVKEVQGLQIGLQKYEAGGVFREYVTRLDPGPISFLSGGDLGNITNGSTPALASHLCGCFSTADQLCDLSEP